MNHSNKTITSYEDYQQYFESLTAVSAGHVYWKDLNCRFLGCNDLQAKVAGLKDRRDIVGLSAYDAITKNQSEAERIRQADAINRVDQQVMRTGVGLTIEEPLILEDGTERIYLSQKIPLRDKNNRVIGLLGSSMDITPQKKAEEQARKSKEELEAVSQIKQSFLANMRHDIRTPFSGVLSGAQVLAEEETDPLKKELLQNIAKSSEKLLHYLNEILEFTEMENGHVPLIAKAFNLEELLDDCYALFLPSASQKKLEFKKIYGSSLPKWIISDRFRIHRIIINLLSNAIKFTHQGTISMGIDFVEKKDNEKGVLKIMIKDTGIGIPQDKKNIIFEKFEMVVPAYQSNASGIGLGLGAVRDLVKSLNGNIFLQSAEGEGSAFICVIPFDYPLVSDAHVEHLFDDVVCQAPVIHDSVSNKKNESNVIQFKNNPCKVLLVEDSEIAAIIAKKILEQTGCLVVVATNGREAVENALKEKFDFILMDIGLPDFDGIEATRIIINSQRFQTAPIIALSAHLSGDVEKNCLNVGMVQAYSKPLTTQMAHELIETFYSKNTVQAL